MRIKNVHGTIAYSEALPTTNVTKAATATAANERREKSFIG
jgi:hypothetical protein